MYKERLRMLRDDKNITQEDMANKMGIVGNRYGQYEREYEIIPLKHLIVACNYFDVSLDYIFNFSDTKQYKNSIKEISKLKSGERLKNFRKENKLTQVKLAEKLNIVNTIISEYEKGNFLISTHALYTICKKYNISADYLLSKIDEPKYFK